MRERVKYDEDFFSKYSREILVNKDLPFKLQKRELLEKLGFPIDDTRLLPMRDCVHDQIAELVKSNEGTVFLIGIHLKPMTRIYTPFFIVEEGGVKHRDELGKIQIITQEEMFEKIKKFPPQTWLEITRLLWGPTTTAGRLIYFSFAEQLIEIQKGVMPQNIGREREQIPYFKADLQFFEISDKIEYGHLLLQSDFKKADVESIISSLARHAQGFESLRNISRLPTLEFAYTVERGLVVVDVDWPEQYQRTPRNNE